MTVAFTEKYPVHYILSDTRKQSGGTYQPDLFNTKPQISNLYGAIDALRNKYGTKIIRNAGS